MEQKNFKREKAKNNAGITLIALVVTIIVLIILAGISISMLTGQNGILNRAAEAREKTKKAQREEQAQLADLESLIENGGESVFDTESGANKPALTQGMIPVKWNGTKWVICSKTDPEWYNYKEDKKQWANVMLSDGKYYSADANLTEAEKTGKTLATENTQVAEADLGSMFVWIPRFAYKITAQYHDYTTESTPGGMDVKFLIGRTDKTIDNAEIVDYNATTTNNYTQFPNGYVVHPAFKDGKDNGYSNGEWKKEVLGIWVAKFQAGIKTTDNDTSKTISTVSNYYYPVFKGRKFGYNYVSESQCYNISLALDDAENPYGLTSSANSHLMKSSEWGAAAYLSMSQYGYSGGVIKPSTEKARNNLDINGTATHPNNSGWGIYGITGYSAPGAKTGRNAQTFASVETTLIDTIGNSTAWTVVENGTDTGAGTISSTTGNIYGIYDMSSGLGDYTAAYVNNLSYTGNGSAFATGTSTYLATAYPNKATTSNDFTTAYHAGHFKSVYGDAFWETSNAQVGRTSNNAWFGDYLEENTTDGNEVFFPRGGNVWFAAFTGLCGSFDFGGHANDLYGFHSVLVVE